MPEGCGPKKHLSADAGVVGIVERKADCGRRQVFLMAVDLADFHPGPGLGVLHRQAGKPDDLTQNWRAVALVTLQIWAGPTCTQSPGAAGWFPNSSRPTSPRCGLALQRASASRSGTVSPARRFGPIERVTAIVEDFALTDANAPLVVEICRRLDGLPLAIEFAAPRVEALGVEGLAARLDDSLPLLGAPRRTALPRHRTMRAVADWSYGLLSEDEQLFFRALGIFTGVFTVEAAAAVAMDAANAGVDALGRLADLVAKSLVVADVSGAEPRFRLLDTTRAYAIEKLDESGERERIARRYAEHYRNLFERAEGEELVRPRGEWQADYSHAIDNLRAALDWAYSSDGDAEIGVALTAAAAPLWMRLSLHKECRSRAKQALGALGTEGTRYPRDGMRLHAALGTSTAEAPEMGAAFTKALEIAESLGDTEYQLRALGGLYFFHAASSRHRAALPFAQRFHDLAATGSDLSAQLFGEHIMGLAKHFLGDQISARRHLGQVLTHYTATDHGRDVIRFQIDVQVSTLAFLARVLWLQGFSDQAVRTAEMSIESAQATGHALSLCYALALAACPIALWVGNLAAAAHYAGMLLDESTKHSLPLWSELGARFKRVVVLRGGGPVTGSCLLQAGPDEIAEPNVRFQSFTGLTELAEALTQAGRVAEGLAVVEAGLEQPEGRLAHARVATPQGRAFSIAEQPWSHGNGGGPLPAGARPDFSQQEGDWHFDGQNEVTRAAARSGSPKSMMVAESGRAAGSRWGRRQPLSPAAQKAARFR
jgi:hypothetical protein